MTRTARSIVKSPDVQAEPVELWDHQRNEPHDWYVKFRHFLMEGPTRSITKAKESYEEVYEEEPSHIVTWYKARAKYHWWKRAYAYDCTQQDREEEAVLAHRIAERKLSLIHI